MSKLSYQEMQFLKRNKQRQGLTVQEAYSQVGETLKAIEKVKPVKEKKDFKSKFRELKE